MTKAGEWQTIDTAPDALPWSSASEPVWALVCHFSGEHRRGRQLMAVRACIDDGGGGVGPVFVLAGYIASAQQWAAFSDDWKVALDMNPAIKRFKMSEAARWSERLPLFYAAIEKHVMAGVSITIPYDSFRNTFGSIKHANNPYYLAFRDMIAQVANHQRKLGIHEPIDFIFDKGNSSRMGPIWTELKRAAPQDLKQFMGNEPQFLDDERVLPLQAADLHAWLVRRAHAAELDTSLGRCGPWPKVGRVTYLKMEWTEETIREEYKRRTGRDKTRKSRRPKPPAKFSPTQEDDTGYRRDAQLAQEFPRCRTCTHWLRRDDLNSWLAFTPEQELGECRVLSSDPPARSGPLAQAVAYGESQYAQLVTDEQFGCVLHKPAAG